MARCAPSAGRSAVLICQAGPGTISRGLVMYQAFVTANGRVVRCLFATPSELYSQVSLGSFVEFEHDGVEGIGVVTQAWQLPSGPKWCRQHCVCDLRFGWQV